MSLERRILVCGAIALTLAAACQQGAPESSPEPKVAAEIPLLTPSDAFQDLAPDSGDVLVPPRIGMRWSYVPRGGNASVTPDSTGSGSAGPHFRVQVVDSAGIPYIDMETTKTEVQVTLPPRTPAGTYRWWVERRSADDSTVEMSRVHKFEIR